MTSLNIPPTYGRPINIELKSGDALYILGANGTGKSSLLYSWARANPTRTFIAGNREIVLGSSAVSMSAAQAVHEVHYFNNTMNNSNSRYSKSHHNNDNWIRQLIFSLKSRDEFHNSEYVKADQRCDNSEKMKIYNKMPLKLLNSAFAAAALPFQLTWSRDSELLAKKTGITQSYGIAAMSDGERAALIIAARVILAEENSLVLIDEPERHLHRSISSPLLGFLREIRTDLCWIISTHDLTLPRDEPNSQVVILYEFDGDQWKADLISNTSEVEPKLAEAIYGARDKVLFVEGDHTSLDMPLYKLIFGGTSIVPAGSCVDVKNAVAGLGAVAGLHHMQARGLVDFDNRADEDKLRRDGIFSLKVYSVESIYYHSMVIAEMMRVAGSNATLEEVLVAACESVDEDDVERLARDAAYKIFRHAYQQAVPSIDDFTTTKFLTPFEEIDGKSILEKKIYDFSSSLQSHSWDSVATHFKIRSTKAPNLIARKLGYANVAAYQIAVRKLLNDRPDICAGLRRLIPNPFDVAQPVAAGSSAPATALPADQFAAHLPAP